MKLTDEVVNKGNITSPVMWRGGGKNSKAKLKSRAFFGIP